MGWRALAVAAVMLLAGCGALVGPSQSPTETVTPAPVPDPPTERPGSDIAPGVAGEGVADVDRLARAHRAAVAGRSFTWTERLKATWLRSNRTLGVQSRLRVEDEYTYRYESSSRWSPVNSSEYADGEYRYNRALAPGGVRYRRAPVRSVYDRFGVRAPEAIRRYLAVENATVAVVRADGERRYRVTGHPEMLPGVGRVETSTVRAVVDADGFVRSLNATYLATEQGRPVRVRYRFAYTDVGETAVTPPSWADREWSANESTEHDS